MTVYKARRIVAEQAPILCVVIVFQVVAGLVLQARDETLFTIPILLMLVPAINGLGGNVGTILGARIASGLHVGTITPEPSDRVLLGNVGAAVVVGLVTFTFVTLAARVGAPFLGIPVVLTVGDLLALVVVTGLLLVASLIIISVATALITFRRGLDPDNMVIPVVTSCGDLLGVVWLFVVYGVMF